MSEGKETREWQKADTNLDDESGMVDFLLVRKSWTGADVAASGSSFGLRASEMRSGIGLPGTILTSDTYIRSVRLYIESCLERLLPLDRAAGGSLVVEARMLKNERRVEKFRRWLVEWRDSSRSGCRRDDQTGRDSELEEFGEDAVPGRRK